MSKTSVAKLLCFVLFVQVSVLVVVVVNDHHARKHDAKESAAQRVLIAEASRNNTATLAGAARAGCERLKKDRRGAIRVNTSVLDAFRQTDKRLGGKPTKARVEDERRLKVAIQGLRKNASINCRVAYPDPPPVPK